MDAAHQHALGQQRFTILRPVATVCPNGGRGVAGIEQRLQPAALVCGSVGNQPLSDQAVPPVGADVVLVAEGREGLS